MQIIVTIILSAIAVFVTAYILPGVTIKGFGASLVVAVLLALVNTFIKPLLLILTLPINFLTLGFFTLVINALLVMLVDAVTPGFEVKGFWWALLFSIILSVVSGVLNSWNG